jgi:hypothetical protein
LKRTTHRRTKQHQTLFPAVKKDHPPLFFVCTSRRRRRSSSQEEEEDKEHEHTRYTRDASCRCSFFLAAAKMEKEEKQQRRGRGDKEGDYKKRTGKETLSRREMLEETTEESAQL